MEDLGETPNSFGKDHTQMLRAIDLFAGAGGLSLGMRAAGITTACAIEIDARRAETLAAHGTSAEIIASDIRQVDLSPYRGKVEIVFGGPPCQPFSSGGLRQAAADERNMVPAFVQAVRAVRPDAFLMENVPGLAVRERRGYFRAVLEELHELGYHLAYEVLNAANYGAPQKRRRLFVVGMRPRVFHFPARTHGPGGDFPYVVVNDVLPSHQIGDPNPSRVFYAKRPDIRPSPYDGHMFNGGGRPIDRCQPCHTILASAGGNKTHFFDDMKLVPEYHRHLMCGNPPRAGTLPGARRLTVLESAIIQTFHPDTRFCGPRSSQYQQVGDAVPPKLAEVLGRALLRQLLASGEEEDGPDAPLRQRLLWS
ncbi:MAG: DNA cytosine methyltransferase [Isosphaeraceae bacterium]